eukprot:bmy_00780T0
MTTARSSGRLLGGAAAAADWSKQGAESVNCPRPRGRRIGPLTALAAARSVTVPVRASFLTARASTVSALRSSSDDKTQGPCPLGSGQLPGPTCPVP